MHVRDCLFDIAKIVEGAADLDPNKVVAFANQLADRLEAGGEADAAKRIRRTLSKKNAKTMNISRVPNPKENRGDFHLPVDSESRLPTADEEFPTKGEVDFVASRHLMDEIEQFLTHYRAADRLIADGVGVSATMLLYGPPGCGKTQLARYLASELDLPLITARVDALISSYLGSTAKNLRQLFDYAARHPCVLFLDEFDALAKMRDDTRELGELKRVVITLLQNIDSLGQDNALIAATNHDHLLDPAIWRRFACKIHLDVPDEETRRELTERFLSRFSTQELVDVITWAAEGMSGAQLRQAIDNCIREAIIKEEASITLRAAVDRTLAANPKMATAVPTLEKKLRTLHAINPKAFTQDRLSKIFGISQPKVSRLMKKGVSRE